MRLRRACILALALGGGAGCRQVLGFEDPIVDDGPAFEVTGRYRQHHGGNNAAGEPQIDVRIRPVGELMLSVVLADGVSRPVEYRSDGTFSFLRSQPDEPYRLVVGKTEYQHTAAHLELGELSPGRLDVEPVTQPTLVQVRLGAQPAGSPYVATTGIWGKYSPGVGAGVGDFDIPWSQVDGTAPFGLLSQAKHDRLYIAFLEATSEPQSYLALTRVFETAITQVDGGTVTVGSIPPGLLPLLPRSYCVRQQARRADAMTRVRTALPMFPTISAEYAIVASARADDPFLPYFLLAYDATTGGSDANLDVFYGNPFPGTQVLSGIGMIGGRDAAIPGVPRPLKLTVAGQQKYPLAMVSTCPVSMPVLDLGIASVPSLGGAALTTDGAVLVIPGEAALEIRWQLGSAGVVDYANVVIYEVDVDQDAPQLREAARIVTAGQSVTVPRVLFDPLSYYVVAVRTVRGVPGASTGDFKTVTYPNGWMLTMSSPFRVDG